MGGFMAKGRPGLAMSIERSRGRMSPPQAKGSFVLAFAVAVAAKLALLIGVLAYAGPALRAALGGD
jgi:hypothetical protein